MPTIQDAAWMRRYRDRRNPAPLYFYARRIHEALEYLEPEQCARLRQILDTGRDSAGETQAQMPPERELLRPSEVAGMWRVSPRTVQRYAAAGKRRAVQLPGGHYRIHRDDVSVVLGGSTVRGNGCPDSV